MQEETTGNTPAKELPKKRGRKPSVVITFDKVRIFKSFMDKKLSAKEAAAEAEMPESTFYWYAKMDMPELIKLAQKSQYEAMSPEEQKAYDTKVKRDQEFHETLNKVKAFQKLRDAKRQTLQAKKQAEYAAQQKKHPLKSRVWGKDGDNKLTDSFLSYQEMKCYICGKVFMVPDKVRYTYKKDINGRQRFCCSYVCLNILKKRSRKKAKK